VRAFSDNNIIHVENRIHPKDDADIINLELILADLQGVESRLDKAKKRAKGVVPKELALEIVVLEKIAAQLGVGKRASGLSFTEDEMVVVKELHLITMKPMLYVVNIDDAQHADTYRPVVEEGVPHIYISAKTEAELGELSPEDAAEFMKELGMEESGLDTMIRAGYELLGLVTFFTCGEIETRAWTVEKNTKAPLAAGTIHTDFIKGFIKADVVNWKDFVAHGGWGGIKGTGKLRLEGKEYIVQDGDVVYFHVN
jgi:GTP-binding protein YchF